MRPPAGGLHNNFTISKCKRLYKLHCNSTANYSATHDKLCGIYGFKPVIATHAPPLKSQIMSVANVGPSYVRVLSVPWSYLENWAKHTNIYYGTWQGWQRWSFCRIRSSPDPPWGNIQIKICADINTASCWTWRQITSAVNRVRPSKLVVNSHHPLRWQHVSYDAKVEQEAGQLLFAWRHSCYGY